MISRLTRGLLSQKDPIAAAKTLPAKIGVAIVLVKKAAEAARGRFITEGSGKMAEYNLKNEEVDRWREAEKANSDLDQVNCPMARRRAILKEKPVADVILEWETLGNGWKAAADQICGLEEQAVEDIRKATNEAQIRAAMAVKWPKPVE